MRKNRGARHKGKREKNECRPLKIIDSDTSSGLIHRYLFPLYTSARDAASSLLALAESRSSWHLACIPAADDLTFLHELRVYSISRRDEAKGFFNGAAGKLNVCFLASDQIPLQIGNIGIGIRVKRFVEFLSRSYRISWKFLFIVSFVEIRNLCV